VFELSKQSGTWTETVLYNFGGGSGGAYPRAGLVMDKQGNLYGTTDVGGIPGACNSSGFAGYGCGTVFELSPTGNGWTETILYAFTGGADGGFPYAALILDKSGNLYGTTYVYGYSGGCNGYGCGAVYKLTHGKNGWIESTLYAFTGVADGGYPVAGLIFDPAGNLYGTTSAFGPYYYGTVFQLHPTNGGWKENTIYTFTGGADGGSSQAALVGKGTILYGTTYGGGTGTGCGLFGVYPCGVVFSLTHGTKGWTENVLYAFQGSTDGGLPEASVTVSPSGSLMGGTALMGGEHAVGAIFEIKP
jgi:hypothetical protein